MTGTDSINRDAKAQALRLQRFYLAQMNYLIGYILISVAWVSGEYVGNSLTLITHFILGIGTQAGFWVILKSGLNKHFRDPSLASLQIATGTVLVSYLMMFLGDLRGSMLLLYPMGMIFGVFQLDNRSYLLHSILALGCYAAVLLVENHFRLSNRDLSIQLIEWAALACFLGWLCVFAGYVRKLKEQLQHRHSTLRLHQETLKGMTLWAAYSNFEEYEKGSVSPGKFADFVLLSEDIMTVPHEDIPHIEAEGVFVAGTRVK